MPLTEPMPPKAERWPLDEKENLLRTMKADPAVRRLLAKLESQKVSKGSDAKGDKVSSAPGGKNTQD
jgi:hypothetical protein